MAKKQGGYWWMLAAAAVIIAFAYGCGGQSTVDHGGSPVSEEGQIAFTRITNQAETDIESDIYTINVDGSHERKLTYTPGLDGLPTWSPDGKGIAFVSDRDRGNWRGHQHGVRDGRRGQSALTARPSMTRAACEPPAPSTEDTPTLEQPPGPSRTGVIRYVG